MSEVQEIKIGQSISKNSFVLAVFAAATAGLIAFTFQATKDRVAESERRAAQKALLEIVPQNTHDNDLLNSTITLPASQSMALGYDNAVQVNVASKNGKPIAYIFPAIAADGYSGDIKLIIGIMADGSVAGVRALAHKETPGLGDKVDIKKSDWILSFNGKSLSSPSKANWKVKKDGGEFDQFTGATITPRAVVRQVKEALELYQIERAQLLEKSRDLINNMNANPTN